MKRSILKKIYYRLGVPIVQEVKPSVIDECKACKKKALQSGVITSYLLDESGQPVLNAHIINLNSPKNSTTTGLDGKFTLRANPTDNIKITHVSGEQVTVKAGSIPQRMTFKTGFQLDGITLTPKTPSTPNTPAGPKAPEKEIKPRQTQVQVSPNLNDKADTSKKWLWLALIVLGVGVGLYLFNRSSNPKA